LALPAPRDFLAEAVVARRDVGPAVPRVGFFAEAAVGAAGAVFFTTAGVVADPGAEVEVEVGVVALAAGTGFVLPRGLKTWARAKVALNATRPATTSMPSKRAADIASAIVPQRLPRSRLLIQLRRISWLLCLGVRARRPVGKLDPSQQELAAERLPDEVELVVLRDADRAGAMRHRADEVC